MQRIHLLWLLTALGCSARPAELECPARARDVAGVCRLLCQDSSECLSSERCSDGVCVPGAGDDAGEPRKDAQVARDASEVRPDANIGGDAGLDCHNLDEPTCRSTRGCTAFSCPTCTQPQFAYCANPGEGPPPCAAPLCGCAQHDEDSCRADPSCQAVRCLDCRGDSTYLGCGGPDSPLTCGELRCGCERHLDPTRCQDDRLCHPLLTAVCTDGIPPVCHMEFSRCGNGARATCDGPVSCRIVTPICEDGTIVATNGFCYEGCVRPQYCDAP